MAKIEVLTIAEMKPYFAYIKLETELKAKLTWIEQLSEWKLKTIKDLNVIAKQMNQIREGYHFKTEKDILKAIRRYSMIKVEGK